jgi:hypothetical protein
MYCENMYREGKYYDDCTADATSPTFATDQFLGLTNSLIQYIGAIYGAEVMLDATMACAVTGEIFCGGDPMVASLMPWTTAVTEAAEELAVKQWQKVALWLRERIGLGFIAEGWDQWSDVTREQINESIVADEVQKLTALTAADQLRRLGMDPNHGGAFQQRQQDLAVAIQNQRGVKLFRWPLPSGPAWVGADGSTYRVAGPFDPNNFNAQAIADQVLQAINTHQGSKASYVLVDTVGLRADQISQLKDLLLRFQPYAFFLD